MKSASNVVSIAKPFRFYMVRRGRSGTATPTVRTAP